MGGSFAKSRESHKTLIFFFLRNLMPICWLFCKSFYFLFFIFTSFSLGFAGEKNDKPKPLSATTHPEYLAEMCYLFLSLFLFSHFGR
jgi:hypothetical protein